jgi:hypothetical protein
MFDIDNRILPFDGCGNNGKLLFLFSGKHKFATSAASSASSCGLGASHGGSRSRRRGSRWEEKSWVFRVDDGISVVRSLVRIAVDNVLGLLILSAYISQQNSKDGQCKTHFELKQK